MSPRRDARPRVRARFDDLTTGSTLQLSRVDEEIVARTPDEVLPVLRAVQERVDAGAWAAGMIAYEAAPALDPALHVAGPTGPLPLVQFMVSDAPDPDPGPPMRGTYRTSPWTSRWTEAEHAQAAAAVRAAIAEGDTYQANLTTRLHGHVEGDLLACHLDLVAAQRGAHGAYLDLGTHAVLSASPELFVRRDGDELTTAPMKGTAARGSGPTRDAAARADLLRSPKERAENIMIVDLLRNDLARVAETGSVAVPQLLHAERYPTLWQMTSTVTARATAGTGLAETMAALFPCGSVTGAPKAATMDLLSRLETGPRGAYCGAIGWMAPARPGAPATSSFSVGIRTLVVDTASGQAEYGVGSGITWASDPAAEWQELQVKARVLEAIAGRHPAGPAADPTAGAPPRLAAGPALPSEREEEPFALLETLAVRHGRPAHLPEHLDRLLGSAARFAVPAHRDELAALVQERSREIGDGGAVLRLALDLEGTARITTRQLPQPIQDPVLLALDTEVLDPDDPAVRHKTTDRAHLAAAIARARARHPEVEDVLLRGRGGRVTESTSATLLVEIDGRWCTPPLADGVLAGVGRRLALEAGEVHERSITPEELRAAPRLALLSAVRGLRPAVLVG